MSDSLLQPPAAGRGAAPSPANAPLSPLAQSPHATSSRGDEAAEAAVAWPRRAGRVTVPPAPAAAGVSQTAQVQQQYQLPSEQRPTRHAHSKRPPQVAHFIDANLAAAEGVSKEYGIPVSVILGQAALETEWGRAVKGNAYFGVKGSSGTAGGTTFGTHEVDEHGRHAVKQTFRAFHNFAEAADDYARVISTESRYRDAMATADDPMRMVDAIARAEYATDPNYAAKVKATIKSQHLTDYDRVHEPPHPQPPRP